MIKLAATALTAAAVTVGCAAPIAAESKAEPVAFKSRLAVHVPAPEPKPDHVIGDYVTCETDTQTCVDTGRLVNYYGIILAGHNFRGWQWLSRVPVGDTVRVKYGPLAGNYRVYDHMHQRADEYLPMFKGSDLVLQSCEGDEIGFSLAHKIME